MTRKSKRQEILEAALRLMVKAEGEVSLLQIAVEAGVSRQALYLHFADRSSLLREAVQYADERRGLSAALHEIKAAQSGREMLRRWVTMQARDNPRIWGLARAADAMRHIDAEMQTVWQERLENRLQVCRSIVTRLQREGCLPAGMRRQTAAEWLAMCTSLHAWEYLVLERGWSATQYEVHVMNMLRQGLFI